MEQVIRDTLRVIYQKGEKESKNHPVDREFIIPYLPVIDSLDTAALIVTLCNDFPDIYSMGFLCCTPEIWKKMDSKKIDYVLLHLNDIGRLSFFEFTYKVLEIDLFGYFCNIQNVSNEIKVKLLEYFIHRTSLLQMSEEDIEDFEDGVFACLDFFLAKKVLVQENTAFNSARKTDALILRSLRAYLKEFYH